MCFVYFSLTKEVKLTQTLMDLFIKYQVRSFCLYALTSQPAGGTSNPINRVLTQQLSNVYFLR